MSTFPGNTGMQTELTNNYKGYCVPISATLSGNRVLATFSGIFKQIDGNTDRWLMEIHLLNSHID